MDRLGFGLVAALAGMMMAPFAPAVAQSSSRAQERAAARAQEQADDETVEPATSPGSLQAARTPGPASAPLRPYRINPGDELEVYVWGEERLQRVIRVLPDGTFSFPLVGRVEALGRLPTDIETVIAKGLVAQYRGAVPQVTVSVRNPSGLQFSVAGKVRSPGTFTPGHYLNVLEALSIAGGPTEFADLGNVTILRKNGDQLTSRRVRLSDAWKGNLDKRDLVADGFPQIQSGDTVIVP